MFISFGRKLIGLGKLRIGAGIRLKGATGWVMAIVYGLVYLCWYMILGTLWLLYGTCYVCFYLPYVGIKKLIDNNKKSPQE